MTRPGMTTAQKMSLAHARAACLLAKDDPDIDRFLSPADRPVVRAYRALTHALIATWAMTAPDDLVADAPDLEPPKPKNIR